MVLNSTSTSSNIKLDKTWQVDVVPKEPTYFDRFLPTTHQQTTLAECGIDSGDEHSLPYPKIHVLAIRQPWASLVIHGLKNIDIRSKNTSIRGTIAIYASRAPIRKKDLKWVNENYDVPLEQLDDLPTGMIIGTVNLIECMEYESDFHFKLDHRRHLSPEENYSRNIKGWLLKSPRPIEPVNYKFNGEVVWSLADTEILQQTA
ncbi:ASCH domain-containing protein [Methanococcoides sp. NM1]|uniref:ASCH domain-containing protein n=1 Tax=Methanococcoides sp. NM1 TaxID=1201013 RepID=UPI0010844025|nr:ASCH domain-containing protein [Methanococcoides sp. NM1]